MRLELLAPAGDIKSFDAAVNSGADAVYLGLGDFNARMKAENFSVDNIGEVVRRAHFYGVKVYVTINTILQNQEFKPLFELVNACIRAKVDAYLVQDLGVAYALKNAFPGIVLHASTQIGVHNLYGAKVAEKIGFKRVVLSRETKLEDIKAIRKHTNLEIEYFVQGALCVAFSGNCYMSSKEQGASGNRGLCKQLCRLPYVAGFEKNGKFERAGEGYLLSARDLSLAENLKDLIDAGVSSFKIEGRLRREGFVAEAVSIYRHLLDEIETGEKSLSLTTEEKDRLKASFSRGEYLERAYLDSGTPFVIEKRFNNHIGIRIGVVKKVAPFKDGLFEITIESSHPLSNGDGLKFFDGDVEKASLGVGSPKPIGKNLYSFVSKTAVKAGYAVNLTLDSEEEKEVLSAIRTVPVKLSVSANVGKPFVVKASASVNGIAVEGEAKSDTPLEKATNAPTSIDEIKTQCSKVADSGFEVEEIQVDTNGVFLPKSVANSVRRNALAALKEEIIALNEREIVAQPIDDIDKVLKSLEPQGKYDFEDALSFVRIESETNSVILRKGERVVLAPNDYSASAVKKALDNLDLDGKDVVLQLPIIANGEDLQIIEKTLEECGIKTVVSENLYGLYFAGKCEVIAGAGHNIANRFAAQQSKELGAIAFAESIEYTQKGKLPLVRVETKDELPLMTFAHCPFKTIYGNDCSKCTYKQGLILKRERHQYKLRRIRIAQCYFQLFPKE
ncbi:MAG: U32 family peptidase [Clostridia bacterium]|nr:U32 family peptidase [Clostridia bacterium]